MHWLTGDWSSAGAAAGKAALLFALAAIGFRINPRRTLSEYSPFDFAALLGTGAIIGRTATAKDTSFAVGAAALIALLAIHNIVSRLRFARWFSLLLDPRVSVLIRDGRPQRAELRRAALTDQDISAILRQHGIEQTEDVRLALYEPKGAVSVFRREDGDRAPEATRWRPRPEPAQPAAVDLVPAEKGRSRAEPARRAGSTGEH